MNETEKLLKSCIAEIGFNNCKGAAGFIAKILGMTEQWTGPHQYGIAAY